MLTRRTSPIARINTPTRQRGVVLFIALIALVAMSLAAIALVRSVDTSNIIAGNLAFQQGATNNGDVAIEAATTWLSTNSGSGLFADQPVNGYYAVRQDPNPGETWPAFWASTLAGQASPPVTDNTTGNSYTFVIHRLCATPGDPLATSTGCASNLTTGSNQSNSRSAGSIGLQGTTQVYYRITARINGPRNTVSYVQSMVLM